MYTVAMTTGCKENLDNFLKLLLSSPHSFFQPSGLLQVTHHRPVRPDPRLLVL